MSTIYDDLNDVIVCTFRYQNASNGNTISYQANYLNRYKQYNTTISSISDSVSSDLAKQSLMMTKFAIQELTESEEVDNKVGLVPKDSTPSQLVIYGIEINGSNEYQKIPILKFQLIPLDRNVYGRPSIYIGTKYKTGKEVSQALEDEIEDSPSYLKRQVARIEWDSRIGKQILEYAGTPRQIINWFMGGLPFALDIFTEDDFELVKSTMENENSNYSDDRLKPGDTFNSAWEAIYSQVVELNEVELEFIDSNNAPSYSMFKSIASTMNIIQNRIIRFFNKFFLSLFDELDIHYWLNILNTKLYNFQEYVDYTSTIIDIETDLYNKILSITLDNTTNWPPFGFFWHGEELCQYRSKNGNQLIDIDRNIRGSSASDFVILDTITMRGNLIRQEDETLFRDRLSSLLGPKESLQSIQEALDNVVSNTEGTVTVFDLHCKEYLNPDNKLSAWVTPKRDIGWFLGSEGYPVISEGVGNYDVSEKTLTITILSDRDVLSDIRSGAKIQVSQDGYNWLDSYISGANLNFFYTPQKEAYDNGDLVTEPDYGDIILTTEFYELPDTNNLKFRVFGLGSETNKIRSVDLTNKLNFAPQTLIDKYLETTGYFMNTFEVTDIIYETDLNNTATTLYEAELDEDTGIFGDDSSPSLHPWQVNQTNDKYNYTGNILHYTVEPLENHPLSGRYPFMVIVNNWHFNNNIIEETVNRLKAVGTTPNYAINKNVKFFRTIISNERIPNVQFAFTYHHGE